MNRELAVWFRETFIHIQEYKFGVYESSSDLASQTKMWKCFGCGAEAMTGYLEWGEPRLLHEDNCKYLELLSVLYAFQKHRGPNAEG